MSLFLQSTLYGSDDEDFEARKADEYLNEGTMGGELVDPDEALENDEVWGMMALRVGSLALREAALRAELPSLNPKSRKFRDDEGEEPLDSYAMKQELIRKDLEKVEENKAASSIKVAKLSVEIEEMKNARVTGSRRDRSNFQRKLGFKQDDLADAKDELAAHHKLAQELSKEL
jgi:hypothetical protein